MATQPSLSSASDAEPPVCAFAGAQMQRGLAALDRGGGGELGAGERARLVLVRAGETLNGLYRPFSKLSLPSVIGIELGEEFAAQGEETRPRRCCRSVLCRRSKASARVFAAALGGGSAGRSRPASMQPPPWVPEEAWPRCSHCPETETNQQRPAAAYRPHPPSSATSSLSP